MLYGCKTDSRDSWLLIQKKNQTPGIKDQEAEEAAANFPPTESINSREDGHQPLSRQTHSSPANRPKFSVDHGIVSTTPRPQFISHLKVDKNKEKEQVGRSGLTLTRPASRP